MKSASSPTQTVHTFWLPVEITTPVCGANASQLIERDLSKDIGLLGSRTVSNSFVNMIVNKRRSVAPIIFICPYLVCSCAMNPQFAQEGPVRCATITGLAVQRTECVACGYRPQ